ncbi:MAG: hypothetical protein PUC33_06245 [Oscillospiraceae bacterium]|nr:hypothetical protein [Oscillospiraceae bacterium]
MKELSTIKSIKKYRFMLFGYIPVMFMVFFLAFLLLRFPERAAQGVTDGIDLCLGTLIPTLYPFMILSSLLTEKRFLQIWENLLSGVCNALFRLPGKCAPVILLSMIGGLPIGGKMTEQLYESGQITRSQGRRMLLFCIGPGPAFVISSVGFYMLGTKKGGLLLYISIIASTLLIGVLSRFLPCQEDYRKPERTEEIPSTLSQLTVKSVYSGSVGMMSVCAWVISFSCINSLLEIMSLPGELRLFLCSILEMTNGCLTAAGKLPLPVIAGIIGFSGICGHFQVMSAMVKLRLNYKLFLTARIISAALSMVICCILQEIFPVSYEVFSASQAKASASSVSVPVSIGMMAMCGLLLLGDGVALRIKKRSGKKRSAESAQVK